MEEITVEEDVPFLCRDHTCSHLNESYAEVDLLEASILESSRNDTIAAEILSNDQQLKSKIPKLPFGIDRYFFVSHSSEDSFKVFAYVNELETRFNLSCVYADRDFQPGKDISENIKEGMARSFKVLLFLSPNFQQSGWCKFERDVAFMNSIENGSSCVIPIKLEDCDIPVTLKTLTYIDATNDCIDVPAKIATALVETYEADGFLPLDFTTSLPKYENGYSFRIYAAREPTFCPCSPAEYQFHIEPDILRKLKNNKVEIPEDLLKESIEVINKDTIMRSYDYMKRKYILVWGFLSIPFFVMLAFFVKDAPLLVYASGHRFTTKDFEYLGGYEGLFDFYLAVLSPSIAFIVIIVIITLPFCCNRTKRELSLQLKLWNKFADRFIDTGSLILFSGRKEKYPSIHFMRYNFAKCKEYLAGHIKMQHPEMPAEDSEVLAVSYMKDYLQGIYPKLADDFESLPEAPFTRHNVKKGKCAYVNI